MTVPRWKIHKGVKYSPRRSILKFCIICDSLFLKNTKGRKKYCTDLCSVKARKRNMQRVNRVIIKNRDKFEHANNMRDLYAEGKSSKKSWTLGIDNVPKPKANDDGTIDWDSYYKTIHNKIQKMGLV